MDACQHCGTAPEERRDTATGRVLVICPGCRARGQADKSQARALHTWRLVNDPDLPLYQKRHRPRFRQQAGRWQWYVGEVAGGLVATLEGAVADYMRATRD